MNYCYPERFHWSHTAVVAIGLLKLYCLTAPRNFIIHTVAPGWMGPETNHHRCNVDRNLSLKTRLCWKKDYQQIRPLIIKEHTTFILLTFQLQRLHRLNGWGPPSFTCNPHLANKRKEEKTALVFAKQAAVLALLRVCPVEDTFLKWCLHLWLAVKGT